jgi:hypothetical protein
MKGRHGRPVEMFEIRASPGGTAKLSPARQRGVRVQIERVPEGRHGLRRGRVVLGSRLPGTVRPGLRWVAPPELVPKSLRGLGLGGSL